MLLGVHAEEKRGVLVEVKKTIDMDDMGIIDEVEDMVCELVWDMSRYGVPLRKIDYLGDEGEGS